MRGILLACLLALPGTALGGDALSVPVRLSSGVVLTLRAVSLVGEDLGRRLVLRADFDGPRPPSGDPAQLGLESAEALELCRAHLAAIAALLPRRPTRRITHLEVLYRDTRTHYQVDIHERRGMRVDTRRHGCQGI
ncbi:MAG: hypothetical protein D6686_11245 [Alphaproteobacteria bacterium]|nr:MAG: hypothetical protein D6686_11245 [Alphaproteobacteria bacterium]